MENQLELPKPSDEALAHSDTLAALIRERIRGAGNWIDFADYMDLALYAPGLGYYSAGASKIGAEGDFVTAPEISPLFSRCIARVAAEVLSSCSSGAILEVGAGTGKMAAEIIRVLEYQGNILDRYLILETSADLRERQRQLLEQQVPDSVSRVEWLDMFPETAIDGLILANEVLDALPVSRFVLTRRGAGAAGVGQLQAAGVGIEGDRLCWKPGPPQQILRERFDGIEASLSAPLPDGYTSEISLRIPAMVESLGSALKRGLILIVDYGLPRREYFHPERDQGTLICHYRHRAHPDPFLYPGLQDITAWVDFTAVAEAAASAGLDLAGYTTQANFLLGARVDEEFENAGASDLVGQLELSRQLQTLMMPGEMGERFKVMGLARGIDVAPAAVRYRDLRHLL